MSFLNQTGIFHYEIFSAIKVIEGVCIVNVTFIFVKGSKIQSGYLRKNLSMYIVLNLWGNKGLLKYLEKERINTQQFIYQGIFPKNLK